MVILQCSAINHNVFYNEIHTFAIESIFLFINHYTCHWFPQDLVLSELFHKTGIFILLQLYFNLIQCCFKMLNLCKMFSLIYNRMNQLDSSQIIFLYWKATSLLLGLYKNDLFSVSILG